LQLHRSSRRGHDDRVFHFRSDIGLHLGQSRAHLEGVGALLNLMTTRLLMCLSWFTGTADQAALFSLSLLLLE
jgi:hypothetical protein